MAYEERREEPKVIIPGGNIYQNTVEIEYDKPLKNAIHELYFGAYQNLISQVGLHPNLEIGMHISVEKRYIPYTDKQGLKCRIETIPIVEQEYRYLKTKPVIEPYVPYNRKCTLKERLKILFKGEL